VVWINLWDDVKISLLTTTQANLQPIHNRTGLSQH